MKELLQQALRQSQGELSNTSINNIICIQNGEDQKAWRLVLNNGKQIFTKTDKKANLSKLKFEEQGLLALKEFADKAYLKIPKPLIVENIENISVLMLPWLELGRGGNEEKLGQGLALLHKASSEQHPGVFGWQENGFIGKGCQPKGWEVGWGKCFVDLRLRPQLKVAKKWGLSLAKLEEDLRSIVGFLEKHEPVPSLVHGDLWNGNVAIHQDGRGILFDPCSWWADREVDIAMTKLFGGFSNEFYESYEEVWPLSKSAYERIEIYNLYHLLNHANIFGGFYKNQSIKLIEKIKGII